MLSEGRNGAPQASVDDFGRNKSDRINESESGSRGLSGDYPG